MKALVIIHSLISPFNVSAQSSVNYGGEGIHSDGECGWCCCWRLVVVVVILDVNESDGDGDTMPACLSA